MLQIQINDMFKWKHVKGQDRLTCRARNVYKTKWPNVFEFDNALEAFLIKYGIDFQIEPCLAKPKKSKLFIK